MGKIEDIISIVALILFWVVLIFYRDNYIAVFVLATLLWINVIVKILKIRRNFLPKPTYYIRKTYIYKYIILFAAIISIVGTIKSVFIFVTEGFYKEFNGLLSILAPLMLLNYLDDDRVYLYEKGLVWHGEVLEFRNTNSFQWEADESYNLNIEYEDEKYSIKVPKSKFNYVDKILKDNIKL